MKLFDFNIKYLCFIQLLLIGFYGSAQQTEIVDFIKTDATINPIVLEKKILGEASYTFKVLKKCDSIFLDGVGIILLKVNSKNNISITSANKKIWLVSNFKPNKTYTVSFNYEATPMKALYFTGDQIWTQGQGKYTSHWLPSLDDMNDKMEFNLTINVPNQKMVIANGKLLNKTEKGELNSWEFGMENPMSSYLVAFAVGDFEKKDFISTSGVPIELYINSKDIEKIEPTYRNTDIIFDFLEKEIGVPYPWQNYKQVPVRDFLYAGMENTTATFFSEAFVVDSIGYEDRNYINVNAHELAHQWFGNLVTETEGLHHWLHEGFATYYAHLAEREIFGEDYYYWKLFQSAEQLNSLSNEGKGESLVNSKASSLTFYEKGAWALHILSEIVGENKFKKAIKNYLERYQFKNVTTDDFIYEVELVYGKELTEFRRDWLQQSAFKSEQAFNSLIKSPFMKEYFEISALLETPLTLKVKELEKALTYPNDFLGQEAVHQLEGEPLLLSIPLYKKAFLSNNLYVRQAIALTLTKVPKELKIEYETLLNDESYVTQELAMGNLWVSFPDEKIKYLDLMKNTEGFQDKNIRQFWLFLALLTENYEPSKRPEFIEELKQYTSPIYGHNIREIALEYISYLDIWDPTTLLNLLDASQHHYWRFQKSSRAILKGVLENDKYRNQFIMLGKEMEPKSLNFLNRMLNEY